MAITHRFSISLNQLRFYAAHGLYAGEALAGSEYLVEVHMAFESETPVDKLEQTINYATVYDMVKQRMEMPTGLLECIAQDIAMGIHQIDQRVNRVEVSIQKCNPPIEHFSGAVSVSCTLIF
jgi:7,8-dihydroneopterin aldolase/epimerase/oxygenase